MAVSIREIGDSGTLTSPASKLFVSMVLRDGSRYCLNIALLPGAEPDDVDINAVTDLLILAVARLESLKRHRTITIANAPSILTASEREVLEWIQNGKTTWETATILKISSRTVKFHLANASSKLNANTRTQAVASALSRGLIRTRVESSRIGNLN